MSVFKSALSWLTATTFAPSFEIIFETVFSSPGLSVRATVNSESLPVFCKPLSITLESIVTSILPPDTRQHTFLPLSGNLLKRAAATDTAPAPSEINFCFSISERIAVAVSSSVTVIISSTYFAQRSNVSSPGVFRSLVSGAGNTAFSAVPPAGPGCGSPGAGAS